VEQFEQGNRGTGEDEGGDKEIVGLGFSLLLVIIHLNSIPSP